MTTLREAAQALERARLCITGLLSSTPVRDVTETLSEIDDVIAALAAAPQPPADAIREAVEAERDACAKLAENTVCDVHLPTGIKIYGHVVARAIRARGTA